MTSETYDAVSALEREWQQSNNPLLQVAAGRLRQALGRPSSEAEVDPQGLDWLLTWVMAQDPDAEQHYWHINDGNAESCGCQYQGEGIDE